MGHVTRRRVSSRFRGDVDNVQNGEREIMHIMHWWHNTEKMQHCHCALGTRDPIEQRLTQPRSNKSRSRTTELSRDQKGKTVTRAHKLAPFQFPLIRIVQSCLPVISFFTRQSIVDTHLLRNVPN